MVYITQLAVNPDVSSIQPRTRISPGILAKGLFDHQRQRNRTLRQQRIVKMLQIESRFPLFELPHRGYQFESHRIT